MSMPALSDHPVTTIEALLALPEDGLRHELLDGVHVVTPSPALAHQVACYRFMRALDHVLDRHPQFAFFMSPADVVLTPRTLVQPDIFVVPQPPERPHRSWSQVGTPVLAIEVLSPSTATRDRGTKRRIYQAAGVGEYWIVDLDARLVERWRPNDERPEIIDGTLRWSLPGGVSGELDLPQLFERVLGAGTA